jgi:hypothetical protein
MFDLGFTCCGAVRRPRSAWVCCSRQPCRCASASWPMST